MLTPAVLLSLRTASNFSKNCQRAAVLKPYEENAITATSTTYCDVMNCVSCFAITPDTAPATSSPFLHTHSYFCPRSCHCLSIAFAAPSKAVRRRCSRRSFSFLARGEDDRRRASRRSSSRRARSSSGTESESDEEEESSRKSSSGSTTPRPRGRFWEDDVADTAFC